MTELELYEFIEKRFSLTEIKVLCLELDVDFEDLEGENQSDKARELVQYMRRHDDLERLELALRRLRPVAFMIEPKAPWHSKTIIVNGILILVATINIFLRLISNRGISVKGEK